MSTQLSNRFKKEMLMKTIDMDSDTIKIILMAAGFTFVRATHSTYADVSASELASGSGYTANTATLSGASITQDDTNNQGLCVFDNESWVASGGAIAACGAILYDDTHANDVVIGFIDFGGTQTCQDGGTFTVANIAVALA